MTNGKDKSDALKRLKRMKLDRLRKDIQRRTKMPPVVRRFLTTAVLVGAGLGIKAQSENITDQMMEQFKDTVEQTVPTVYEMFKQDMVERRLSFLREFDALARERVAVLVPAEKADGKISRSYRVNRRNALNKIFGKGNVPEACYRYYCGFAGFTTLRDAGEATGLSEIGEFIDKLSNQNYCPSIRDDLTKACKAYKVDSPQGLTISERIERDVADKNIGPSVYACVIRSSSNTSSGLHYIMAKPQIDENGEVVRDSVTNAVVCDIISFNSSYVNTKSVCNIRPVRMDNLNQLAEKSQEVNFLVAWMEMNPDKCHPIATQDSKMAKTDVKLPRITAPASTFNVLNNGGRNTY